MHRGDQAHQIELYRKIVEEIFVRLFAIENIISSDFVLLSGPIRQECAYLQLRMTIELISLACIVAQGDGSELASVRKSSNIAEVMNKLEKLDKDFFPRPFQMSRTKTSEWHMMIGEPAIIKEDLLKLHARCGQHLHRGNVKNLLRSNFEYRINFDSVRQEVTKLLDLMFNHCISIGRKKEIIACKASLFGSHLKLEIVAAKEV